MSVDPCADASTHNNTHRTTGFDSQRGQASICARTIKSRVCVRSLERFSVGSSYGTSTTPVCTCTLDCKPYHDVHNVQSYTLDPHDSTTATLGYIQMC